MGVCGISCLFQCSVNIHDASVRLNLRLARWRTPLFLLTTPKRDLNWLSIIAVSLVDIGGSPITIFVIVVVVVGLFEAA